MRTPLPDSPYLERVRNVEFAPVFIVGPHRSGTTVLNKLLVDTGRFGYTSIFHIVNRNRLLFLHEGGMLEKAKAELQQDFNQMNISTKGYDNVKVSPDFPEEYAYALEHQGRRPILTPANLLSFTLFCRKVQYVQQSDRPLLLKNPFDANHFLYAAEVFPNARFVFILRNPVDIVNSQLKAIRYVLRQKCEYEALVSERYRRLANSPVRLTAARWIYSERLPLLLRQVVSHVGTQSDYMAKHYDELGERALSVRYQDLCQEPRLSLERVMRSLGQPAESVTYEIAALVHPRQSPALPEVIRNQAGIRQRFAAYCRKFRV